MRAFVGRRWIRLTLLGLAGVLAVGGTVAFGVDGGHSAQNVRMTSGAAWLSSSRVGQLTLLDGSSAEVAAQVQVAPSGNVLHTVQFGHTAYAVDRTAGTVRRVDGTTFEVGEPRSPIPGAGAGLTAFAGADTVYLLDTARGVLATLDPRTLTPRGQQISLAAELAPDAASVDEAGRLWLIDNGTGDLARVAGGSRSTQRKVTPPGRSILTHAGGQPVIVNIDDRKAVTIDAATGKPSGSVDLDLREGDAVAVGGSPRNRRLHIVASRGVLTSCDLAASTCETVVPLGNGGDFGSPVEAGNRLFVPDYKTGQVWIVDLTAASAFQTQVLTPPGQFQLLAQDGVVFFNDPDTERAGVIRLDGRVEPVFKYDPKDPSKGLHKPPEENSGLPVPPAPNTPPPSQPNEPSTDQPPPNQPPPNQPNPPPNRPQPPPNQPNPPPTAQPPPVDTPPTNNPPPAKPVLKITVSKTNPAINEDVSLRVGTESGDVPASAQWDFGDGKQGTGVTVTHQWATAQTYQVSVRATMADGQQATTSLSLTVTPPPTVDVPNVVGQTENTASKAISNANLKPQFTKVANNTVPAGVVISQNPAGGTKVAPQSTVTATVSTGPRAPFDLIAAAPNAAWRTSAGPQSFRACHDDADPAGFALSCPAGTFLMEDNSAPAYLEMHPQWVDNGSIEGMYTLPAPIIAGDHFRSTVGFILPQNPPSAGEVDFVVSVVRPNGVMTEVKRVHDLGKDGVLRAIDVDLTPYVGATRIRLRVDATGTSAQDWACWIAPRVEG